jgi:beta-ureidopropionase / N-carbamoyl-L-amino-acid hydrolase
MTGTSMNLVPDRERIKQNIEKLSAMVDQTKPGWTRRPFTTWYEQSRKWLSNEMLACGMDVRTDAASNLIGTIPGTDPSLKPIMIGSHTDTVTGGGRFDGIIGVVAGLEIARRLKETDTTLQHTLEIVDFTAEEPSEFGISTIGSRGMVGKLSPEMLERSDLTGLKLREGIKMAGGDPERIEELARKHQDAALYLELHIEQGPVLEQTRNKLGVVTGIVGIHRYRVIALGKPNHAGTTPMNMRYDALTAASRLIIALEELCNLTYEEQVVGTVGKLLVEPNGANVIPGRVTFELEVRSLSADVIESILNKFSQFAEEVAKSRDVSVTLDCLSKSEAIRVGESIQEMIGEACKATAPTVYLPSGAGHDANQLAMICPVGMIFVPSKDGRSHCPEEWTDYMDVALGVEALARALLQFDRRDN